MGCTGVDAQDFRLWRPVWHPYFLSVHPRKRLRFHDGKSGIAFLYLDRDGTREDARLLKNTMFIVLSTSKSHYWLPSLRGRAGRFGELEKSCPEEGNAEWPIKEELGVPICEGLLKAEAPIK